MPARPTLRSSAPWRVLDGFGSARAASRYARPDSVDELAELLARARDEHLPVTFRGSGRSYGDAALNSRGLVIDVRGLDRMLRWDPEGGIAEMQPGVTIEGLWRRTLEDGWWPAVVPGTYHPTMGGCVAMNIHGKNCFRVGPYGDHVIDLDLLTPAGERLTLSRQQRPDVFRAVIGGLGLLGAVTRVKLKLKHVECGSLRVRPVSCRSFAAMFECFEQHLPDADYLVGWVDCFAGGDGLGRGLVHRADYIAASEDPAGRESFHVEKQGLPDRIFGLPRGVLWRLMRPFTNDVGMKIVNRLKYWLPEGGVGPDGTYLQSHVAFAFLLDYVPNWRRAYGDSGFIQYQAFVPDATARAAMPELIRLQQRRGIVSYLGVFKRHRADEFLLSHGLDGWSLALDIPVNPRRAAELHALTRDMTKVVLEAGGTFYAAKDAVLEAGEFERAYGDRLTRFLEIKRSLDPDGVLLGDQGRRLMPVLAAG